MKIDSLSFVLELAIIMSGIFAFIYCAGVVWRVEKKLDISFKLLLSALIFFLSAEILDLFSVQNPKVIPIIVRSLKLAFSLFFLFGILETRSMIKKMDGEE